MTTAQEGGEGSASRPGRSLPPGNTRYPLYRGLRGPQGRSGQVAENLATTGIRIRYVTSVKILHVSTPGCHSQRVLWNKRIKFPHANLGLASPSVECEYEVIKLSVSEILLHF
jgi:hypothetical protein